MRISLAVFQPTAKMTFDAVLACEQLGVPAVWIPTAPLGFDPITLLSALTTSTRDIQLNSGIALVYTKHPAAMAAEVFVLGELAPGRVRIGLGSSHPYIIEGMHGLDFGKPVQYMREYITILRQFLWEGQADFEGEYLSAHGAPLLPVTPPRIPITLAALRNPMFKLGGEVSDGILTGWAPISYVLGVAKAALKEGAAAANRPEPPIIPSISVIWHPDRDVARQVAQQTLGLYLGIPSYLDMYAQAGYIIENGELPERLFEELFVYGTPEQIGERIQQLSTTAIDELMIRVEPVQNPPAEFGAVAQLCAQFS